MPRAALSELRLWSDLQIQWELTTDVAWTRLSWALAYCPAPGEIFNNGQYATTQIGLNPLLANPYSNYYKNSRSRFLEWLLLSIN
jgi:hypothetical protein